MSEPITLRELKQNLKETDIICFIDTEFNSKEENIGAVEEVIMLSAIYLNGAGQRVDAYTTWLEPIKSQALTRMIKESCRVTMETLQGKPNIMAVLSQLQWREEIWQPKCYICWGEQDRRVINKTAEFCSGAEAWQPLLTKFQDGQQIFMQYFMGDKYGKRNLLSLEYCARQCGIDFTHQFHAEEDASVMGAMFMQVFHGEVNERQVEENIEALLLMRERQKEENQHKQKKVGQEKRLQNDLAQLREKEELFQKKISYLQEHLQAEERKRTAIQEKLPENWSKRANQVKIMRQKKNKWLERLELAQAMADKDLERECQKKILELHQERKIGREYGLVSNNCHNLRMQIESQRKRLKKTKREIKEKQLLLQQLTLTMNKDKMKKIKE